MTKRKARTIVIGSCVIAVLGSLVFFSTDASSWSKSIYIPKTEAQDKRQDLAKVHAELKGRYPTVDYDSPDSPNATDKAKREKRNKRYDKQGLVMKDPSGPERATVIDSEFDLPALPVALSDVILTADVLNSEAHLSNDKSGVYSEFNVQVDSVIKGDIPTLSQSNLISISRLGGIVRYPSGHLERYEVSKQNMPALGKKYLFFLKATEDNQAFVIVTGYEIGQQRVLPLDGGANFEQFRGTGTTAFLNIVRDAIAPKN